ncbi:MAG: isopenicillin N synthase family oxygenase [Lysobacterales bacterium]|nr:MAG: isopenicillin N synthase family oxygenase [Xanthomonadales bacterium]
MGYATSKQIALSEIPVIDISRLRSDDSAGLARVAARLRLAAADPGFFYVSHHGVPEATLEVAREASRRFFALHLDEKQKVRIDAHHRGFLRVGEAKMYGGANPDLKESYVFGLDVQADDEAIVAGNPLLGLNNWPDFMPELRPACNDFFTSMSTCARSLMRAFAVAMGLAPDFFLQSVQRPVSRGSLIYYPPQPPRMGTEQFGVAPHTDYGCLTLLWQDATGGLEILNKRQEWVTALPIEGTLVVNVGDLLARWTNDLFSSTAHRVINRSGHERYSMALFFDPDVNTCIDPAEVIGSDEQPRYPPVTCGEYILSRYQAAFSYRKS